ncbi:MAG: hypothetical protein U0V70_10410 [Terriglobia bacterium]
MPDFRDSHDPSEEATNSSARGQGFGGASSMIEFSDQSSSSGEVLPSALEQNLRKLLQDVEKIRQVSQSPPEKVAEPDSPYLNRFIERACALHEKGNFSGALEILQEAHKLAPSNLEVLTLIEKAEQSSKLRSVDSDLTDRIAQFKAESLKLFERGQYSECIERFKLLSELDPGNYDLRDYLEISQEEAEKQKRAQATPVENPISSKQNPDPLPEFASQVPNTGSFPMDPIPAELPKAPQANAANLPEILEEAEPKRPQSPVPPPEPQSKPIPEPRAEAASERLVIQPVVKESKSQLRMWQAAGQDQTIEPVQENSQVGLPQVGKKLTLIYLLGGGLLLGSVLGAWLVFVPSRHPKSAEGRAEPQNTMVAPAETVAPPIDLSKPTQSNMLAQAEKALKQGRFLEASRLCDSILGLDPNNASALNLRQDLRERLAKQAGHEMANRNWDKAVATWSEMLKIFPNDRDATRQLGVAKTNLKKQEQLDLANRQALEKKTQDLRQQITAAINAGHYLPPSSNNAFELIQKLGTISQDKSFSREKLDLILRNLMSQANRALQNKDYANASTLVKQIQNYFPEIPESKALAETLKGEESRLAESRNSVLQKAEAAMASGHYVTPPNDNVVTYCTQLLASQPQNPKALDLKKTSLGKAVNQAKSLIQESKYEEAKTIYSVLLYLAGNDTQVPLSPPDLKDEIERLNFNAYAVIHDHTIGSCTGRLRFNGYQIVYLPSGDSKDGFVSKLSEIAQVDLGDKLKIQVKSKTYRFQDNAPKNLPESRTRLAEIQQKLNALIAKSK